MSFKLISTEGMQRRPCPIDSTLSTTNITEGMFIAQIDAGTTFALPTAGEANVYQVWTGKRTSGATIEQRTDVDAIIRSTADAGENSGYAVESGQVTGLFGQYIAETDQYNTDRTYAIGDALVVTTTGILDNDAALVAAGTVIGYVDELVANSDNDDHLRFRRVI